MRLTYRDDKKDGPVQAYYETGALRMEWTCQDDKVDGKLKIYRPDGTIEYVDTYKSGKKVNRKAYDVKGEIEFDQDY